MTGVQGAIEGVKRRSDSVVCNSKTHVQGGEHGELLATAREQDPSPAAHRRLPPLDGFRNRRSEGLRDVPSATQLR